MMRHSNRFMFALLVTATLQLTALAADTSAPADESVIDDVSPVQASKDRLLGFLPTAVSDGLELNAWGWLGGYHNNENEYNNYYDAEIGLQLTKSFNQRVAISAQGNFIDANGTIRGELEQGYVSSVLSESGGSFITIGKFNANFGTEARDFWTRSTGTTSLLFSAQPQDLVGGMLTLPISKTNVTLRPFISEDFQGQYDFNQSLAAGLNVEYQPVHGVSLAVTNWVGSGYVLYGGRPIQSAYPNGAYGDGPSVIDNWQGPNITGQRGGTLYFFEAKGTWQVTQDLHAAAEFLQATSGTRLGRWGWFGVMTQLDYDLTDRLRIFGRFSFLDDTDWLATGAFQRVYEYSGGLAYELYEGVEVRGEYRHDKSDVTGDIDTVSIHLALTY